MDASHVEVVYSDRRVSGTPNEYTYELSAPVQGATRLRFTDFVLGKDPRFTFDVHARHVHVAEPLYFPGPSSVTFQNVVQTLDENNAVAAASTLTGHTFTAGPTVNQVTRVAVSGAVMNFTTSAAHGLGTEWPLPRRVVGSRVDAVLTAANGLSVTGATTFELPTSYCTTTVSNFSVSETNTAFVYTPKLLPSELVGAIQSDFVASGAEFAAAMSTVTGNISWQSSRGPRGASERIVSLASCSPSDVAHALGLQAGTSLLPQQTIPRNVRSIDVPPNDLRDEALFSSALTRWCNPFYFQTAETLVLRLSGGEELEVVFAAGLHTIEAAVAHLHAEVNAALGTMYAVFDAATGIVTVNDTSLGVFSMDLRGTPSLAASLGSEEVLLDGKHTYTFGPVTGHSTFASAQRRPQSYDWSRTLDLRQRVTANVGGVFASSRILELATLTNHATSVSADTVFAEEVVSGTTLSEAPYASALQAGDIVHVFDDADTQGRFSLVVKAGSATSVDLEPSAVTFGAGETIEATSVAFQRDERAAFELWMPQFSQTARWPAEDLVARGVDRAPIVSALGLAHGIYLASSSNVLVMTRTPSLEPPPCVQIELTDDRSGNRFTDCRGDFQWARLMLTRGFSYQSEVYVNHLTFAAPSRFSRFRVRFVHPDGTLVNWRGKDHSWALVIDQ